MPFLKQITTAQGNIGLWYLCETPDGLLSGMVLTSADQVRYLQIGSEKRKREFLAVRSLLHSLAIDASLLAYRDNKSPYLEGSSMHISFSHSSTLVVAMISGFPCGIDTETLDRNVEKQSRRFLSDEELKWTGSSSDISWSRLYCWCAKEAMYKMMQVPELDFRNDMFIEEALPDGTGKGYGSVRCKNLWRKVELNHITEQNSLIVWCSEPFIDYGLANLKMGLEKCSIKKMRNEAT